MKYLVPLLLFLALGDAMPYSVNPGVGAIYKGPHDTTIIEGPDGSRIDAEPYVPGSIVSKDVKAGDITQVAPAEAVPIAPGPIVTRVAPIVKPDLDLRPAFLAAGPILNIGESYVNPLSHTEQILHTSVLSQPIVTQEVLTQNIPINNVATHPIQTQNLVSHNVVPQYLGPIVTNEITHISTNPIVTEIQPIVAPVNPLTVETVVTSPQIIQTHNAINTPSLIENPIIVEDIPLSLQHPNIVEEHVVVGNKIISVPKLVEDNTDLVGPSGTISTRGGDVVISGPSSTTIKGGGVVASIDKQPDVEVKAVEIKPVLTEARAILNPAIAHPPAIIQPELIGLNQPYYH